MEKLRVRLTPLNPASPRGIPQPLTRTERVQNEDDGGEIVEDRIATKFKFSSQSARDSLGPVLDLIGMVHEAPLALPTIKTVLAPNLGPNTQAIYHPGRNIIQISSGSPFRHQAFVHEIGHVLDWCAVGGGSTW